MRYSRIITSLRELIQLVETLRTSCPWDKRQTLSSLKDKIIEESYEFVEAVEKRDTTAVREEIGDILFLGFFLAKIFEETHNVQFEELVAAAVKKYRDKHPHVFRGKTFADQNAVVKFWHKSKRDIFGGVPKTLPALLAAKIIQERASKVGFDWDSHTGPLEKIHEETKEIEKCSDADKTFEEYGDLLFACVNLARHLSINPEDALRHANQKFIERFKRVLEELKKQGKDLDDATLEEMDVVWNEIKKKSDRTPTQ